MTHALAHIVNVTFVDTVAADFPDMKLVILIIGKSKYTLNWLNNVTQPLINKMSFDKDEL